MGYIKNPERERRLKLRYDNYKKQTFEEYKKESNKNMNIFFIFGVMGYFALIFAIAFGLLYYGEERMAERRSSVISSMAEDICNDKGQEYISSKIFIEPYNQLVITCTKENIIKSYK